MKISEVDILLLIGNIVKLEATKTKDKFDVWGVVYLSNFNCCDPESWIELEKETMTLKKVQALFLKISKVTYHELTYLPFNGETAYLNMKKGGAEVPLFYFRTLYPMTKLNIKK